MLGLKHFQLFFVRCLLPCRACGCISASSNLCSQVVRGLLFCRQFSRDSSHIICSSSSVGRPALCVAAVAMVPRGSFTGWGWHRGRHQRRRRAVWLRFSLELRSQRLDLAAKSVLRFLEGCTSTRCHRRTHRPCHVHIDGLDHTSLWHEIRSRGADTRGISQQPKKKKGKLGLEVRKKATCTQILG